MKEVDEATFKSFDGVDLSKIPGSATYILTQNWEKFNDCKTAEDVVMLCHQLFDKSSLDTQWTRKFFYTLDNIIQQNPNPRRAFEQAMYFVSNTKLRGEGLGMNRRRMYECDGKQYSKEQIMEAIKHWQGVLESLGESEDEAFALEKLEPNKIKTILLAVCDKGDHDFRDLASDCLDKMTSDQLKSLANDYSWIRLDDYPYIEEYIEG